MLKTYPVTVYNSIEDRTYDADLTEGEIVDLADEVDYDLTCRTCHDEVQLCPDIKAFLTPLARATRITSD